MYWLPYSSHTSHHPSQTPCLPWISYATQKLMLDSCKMVEKQSEAFPTFLWHSFPSLKQNFIAYRSSKVSTRPDCIFEIHQLWQSGFRRVYSNCCCSCSYESGIIKIDRLSHKMCSNNILNFQVCDNFKCLYKKVWKLIEGTTYLLFCFPLFIPMYVYVFFLLLPVLSFIISVSLFALLAKNPIKVLYFCFGSLVR